MLLARALLARAARDLGLDAAPSLSPAAARVIEARPWPGNVRELKTALQHALVVADGAPVLLPEHLPADPMAAAAPLSPAVAAVASPVITERGSSRFEAEGAPSPRPSAKLAATSLLRPVGSA